MMRHECNLKTLLLQCENALNKLSKPYYLGSDAEELSKNSLIQYNGMYENIYWVEEMKGDRLIKSVYIKTPNKWKKYYDWFFTLDRFLAFLDALSKEVIEGTSAELFAEIVTPFMDLKEFDIKTFTLVKCNKLFKNANQLPQHVSMVFMPAHSKHSIQRGFYKSSSEITYFQHIFAYNTEKIHYEWLIWHIAEDEKNEVYVTVKLADKSIPNKTQQTSLDEASEHQSSNSDEIEENSYSSLVPSTDELPDEGSRSDSPDLSLKKKKLSESTLLEDDQYSEIYNELSKDDIAHMPIFQNLQVDEEYKKRCMLLYSIHTPMKEEPLEVVTHLSGPQTIHECTKFSWVDHKIYSTGYQYPEIIDNATAVSRIFIQNADPTVVGLFFNSAMRIRMYDILEYFAPSVDDIIHQPLVSRPFQYVKDNTTYQNPKDTKEFFRQLIQAANLDINLDDSCNEREDDGTFYYEFRTDATLHENHYLHGRWYLCFANSRFVTIQIADKPELESSQAVTEESYNSDSTS